jgi:para-nitrobenzyl esterase
VYKLAGLLAACALAACGAQAPEADVTGGTVRGYLESPGAVFKGIPFAAPPVGEWRWREPQPVKPWHGARDTTHYSAACFQMPTGTGAFIAPIARRYGVNYPTPRWELSEDCLYLNIWTPEWPVREPHAVMLWIHGGSNRIGSGNEPAYDGADLARHGVVVVTINYRLGAFGFFSHPDLTRESPHHASGDYGLMDQIAALQWVHDNMARFGGDPARVTVFGESAGAIDTGMLMSSPLAHGLFQRAIVESGPVFISYPFSLQRGERFGKRVARLAGSPDLPRLRALPPEAVMRAAVQAAHQEARPDFVVDGWVLPQSPQQVFAEGREEPVNLVIGNNAREASVFRGTSQGSASSSDGALKALRVCYGSMAPLVMTMYYLDTKTGRTTAADSWLTDGLVTCPSAEMAALHAAAGHRSYVYQFRRSIPGKGESEMGSFHSLELAYVFGALHSPAWTWLPFQKADESLAASIESYWTNFAKTGDPNGGGLPQWPAFSASTDDYMEFGNDGRAVPRRGVRPAFCSLDVGKLKPRLAANQ